MDATQFISAGYGLASAAAVRRVLHLKETASDRKIRRKLARHSPSPDDEREAALQLCSVEAWVRQVGRAAGRRFEREVATLSQDAWHEIQATALPTWSHQFTDDYPQLQLDGDRLFARTALQATVLGGAGRQGSRRRALQRLEAARDGEVAPGAVEAVSAARNLHARAESRLRLAGTVLGDQDDEVVHLRQQLDEEWAELAHTIEQLRPYLRDAGIPHEDVIGPGGPA